MTSDSYVPDSSPIAERMWSFNHPLGQFDLPAEVLYNIERWADDIPIEQIGTMSPADFGSLIHLNERLGERAVRAAKQMPYAELTHTLQPVTHDLLRITLEIWPNFEWSEKQHGSIEAFWVWVEDEAGLEILQWSRIVMRPSTRVVRQEYVVAVSSIPKSLTARVISDRWLGAEYEYPISLSDIVMPDAPPPHLPLLDLPLLSYREAFSRCPLVLQAYKSASPTFDPVQTQAFHSVFHTSSNVVICAAGAQSRGVLLEMAIW